MAGDISTNFSTSGFSDALVILGAAGIVIPAFEDSRAQFDVRFYLVAILFIIFDIEVAFLFPWAVSVFEAGWAAWFAMMIFLVELALGFAYAWKKGALEWE